MFTAESTPRFQGERCPASRAGRVPRFRGAHGGAEARGGGTVTKLAARAGRARPAPPGPKCPVAAAARDLSPWGAGEAVRQWEAEGRGSFGARPRKPRGGCWPRTPAFRAEVPSRRVTCRGQTARPRPWPRQRRFVASGLRARPGVGPGKGRPGDSRGCARGAAGAVPESPRRNARAAGWGCRCARRVAVISLCLWVVLDLTPLTAFRQRVNQNFWKGSFACLPSTAFRGDFQKRRFPCTDGFSLGYSVE